MKNRLERSYKSLATYLDPDAPGPDKSGISTWWRNRRGTRGGLNARQEPCVCLATSCRANSVFCLSYRSSFDIPSSTPSPPILVHARGEYGSALTILPLEPPRVYRHDIRGRISYIPLFPSFRIHL